MCQPASGYAVTEEVRHDSVLGISACCFLSLALSCTVSVSLSLSVRRLFYLLQHWCCQRQYKIDIYLPIAFSISQLVCLALKLTWAAATRVTWLIESQLQRPEYAPFCGNYLVVAGNVFSSHLRTHKQLLRQRNLRNYTNWFHLLCNYALGVYAQLSLIKFKNNFGFVGGRCTVCWERGVASFNSN